MERAIKPQNNFGRNIAEAKSKLRGEHHGLSHRRIGKCFFPAPAHEWQFNPGRCLLAITIWKSKRGGQRLWRGEDRKMGLRPVQQKAPSVEIPVAAVYDRRTGRRPVFHLITCGVELNCTQTRRASNMCRNL